MMMQRTTLLKNPNNTMTTTTTAILTTTRRSRRKAAFDTLLFLFLVVLPSSSFFHNMNIIITNNNIIISLLLLPTTSVSGFQQQQQIYHHHHHPLSMKNNKKKKRITTTPENIKHNNVLLFSSTTPASSSEGKSSSSSISSTRSENDNSNNSNISSRFVNNNNNNNDKNENSNNNKKDIISPYEALENFLSVVFDYNNNHKKKQQHHQHNHHHQMIQIVPQGFSTKQLPTTTTTTSCCGVQEVESYVFLMKKKSKNYEQHTTTEIADVDEIIIAITASSSSSGDNDNKKRKRKIDISKVKKAVLSMKKEKEKEKEENSIITLANQDQVLSICGFPIGNIPPPIGSSSFLKSKSSTTVIVDNHLFENKNSNNNYYDRNTKIYDDDGSSSSTLLVFGGGYAYWRCILTPDVLLGAIANKSNNTKIQVASIISDDDENDDDDDDDTTTTTTTTRTTEESPHTQRRQSLLSSTLMSSSGVSNDDGKVLLLPIEAIEVPPIHIAKIVTQQRELSNPLIPSLVTVTGRVGKIHSKRKQHVQCELLSSMVQNDDDDNDEAKEEKNNQQPVISDDDDDDDKDQNSNNDMLSTSGSRSWKSKDGIVMSIDLIVGKKLIHQLGKIQGLAAIENIKEGMDIQIQARTNVESRDSLKKWVESQTLDLVVFDYQILTRKEGGDDDDDDDDAGDHDGDGLCANNTTTITSSSDVNAFVKKRQKYKHRPPSNIVTTSPGMPGLTMNDAFTGDGSIHLVNDLDSLHQFEVDYDKFLSQIGDDGDSDSDGGDGGEEDISPQRTESYSNLIGIDCEWQPSQFNDKPGGQKQPQPVLLMQVSLQSLEQIFIFDLQTMLRPLLTQSTPMNEVENKLCQVLDKVLSSTRVFKAGYQISSDLKRIAASYPHLPCFQEVHSVLEVSALIKRILHITKLKKSRMITQSLARMTEHYIGRTLSKEQQMSNWAVRPIESKQLNYAALDAAVPPKLVEKALESINAKISIEIPKLLRYDGDDSLSKIIESWRFIVVSESTDDDRNNQMIQKLKAKRIVGPAWVVTQNWITGRTPPEMITIDNDDDK